MLSRQASFGCISNSGQPRDVHLPQLPGQPAAQCSSQDRSDGNRATWPANMPVSRLYLSFHGLGYSELGLLTLHGNTGTKGQLEGLKCLAKVARKVSSSVLYFHNTCTSRMIPRLFLFCCYYYYWWIIRTRSTLWAKVLFGFGFVLIATIKVPQLGSLGKGSGAEGGPCSHLSTSSLTIQLWCMPTTPRSQSTQTAPVP